jgi:glyoxylate carboligase
MRLGTDFILRALALEQIDHLFMVPGGLVDPFLPALGRQKAVTPIVAVQEGGAAYMADGYARASGKFGAALCIGANCRSILQNFRPSTLLSTTAWLNGVEHMAPILGVHMPRL